MARGVLTPLEALNKVVEARLAIAKLTGFRTLANLADAGRIRVATKTSLDWNVDVGGEAAVWERVTQDGAETDSGQTVPAHLTLGTHRLKHQFSISKVAIQEAATLAPGELSDLLGEHTDRAVLAIMRKLNQALYAGDGTETHGNLIGMAAIADNTKSYAGIDPAVYPAWKALVNTNASNRAFSRDIMLDVDQLVAENESMYDLVITTPSVAKGYVKVFDTLAGAAALKKADGTMGLPSVDLGHNGRYYNGYPIIEDPQATAGTIHLINTNDLDLFLFELAPGNPGSAPHVVNRSYGIPIHIAPLPSNNSAVMRFEFFVMPQLRLFNRKSLTVINKLT